MKLNLKALAAIRAKAYKSCNLDNDIDYKLGKGGYFPNDVKPSRTKSCDCSGFVSWCIGLSRVPKPSRNWWLETTNIYENAMNRDGKPDVFTRIATPVPGCIVVYGDNNGHEGHIGIVYDCQVDSKNKVTKLHVIDCSSGGSRKLGKAINLRNNTTILGDGMFFLNKGAIFCVLTEHIEK